MRLSIIMNRTIVNPISKLVVFAKRIANNDFFIEDVTVENNDEMGELIRAFNKMKFATGEYITALEEKRKAMLAKRAPLLGKWLWILFYI